MMAVTEAARHAALPLADGDLTPVGQIDLTMPLLAVAGGCLVVAIVLVAVAVVLSRPRRKPAKPSRQGAHVPAGALSMWQPRIAGIVARHAAGSLGREAAFVELADVARSFATQAPGSDLSASTLRDLAAMPRTTGSAQGLSLLRQTVEALYPPEFADAAVNRQAGQVGVEEAAGWVSDLVERWRG